jgi:hypothetical protein
LLRTWLKLALSIIMNQGIRSSRLSDLVLEVEESGGVALLGTGAVLTIETRRNEELSPRERLRKKMIIIFVISILFMIIFSTVGELLPSPSAGRWLILISEVPAFVSALASTRLFVKRPKMMLMPPEQPRQELLKPPVVVPPKKDNDDKTPS